MKYLPLPLPAASDPGNAEQTVLREHEAALAHVQSVLLALDGTRFFNLLEEVRLRYGRQARAQAWATLHRWRAGEPRLLDQNAARLLAALGRQLMPAEMLALLREVRQQWIADLPRDTAQVTIVRGDDLIAVAHDIVGSVRRVQAAALPGDLLAWLGWPADADIQALCGMMLATERYLMEARLAGLMVHLGMLTRLRCLASPRVVVRVQAHLELPTLTAHLRFHPCFWRDLSARHAEQSGEGLLLRLQEMALQAPCGEEWHEEWHSSSAGAWDELSSSERNRLDALTAAVGLHTGSLLQELHIQTLAARADIEATVAVAARMKQERLRGRIVSRHAASGCISEIDVRSGRVFPFLPLHSADSHYVA